MSKTRITHGELKNQLRTGITKFYFEKIDGSLRPAYGTTKTDEIPFDQQPSGEGTPVRGITPFFDIQNEKWRSVSERSQIWQG
jgi:hypothetical protein